MIFSDKEEEKKRKIKEEEHGEHRILLPSFLLTVDTTLPHLLEALPKSSNRTHTHTQKKTFPNLKNIVNLLIITVKKTSAFSMWLAGLPW